MNREYYTDINESKGYLLNNCKGEGKGLSESQAGDRAVGKHVLVKGWVLNIARLKANHEQLGTSRFNLNKII